MTGIAAAWATVLAVLLLGGPARGQPLVADISDHLIAVSTSFTGARVVVFGVADAPGDIVVVVQGPNETVSVRRKDNVGGLWVNRDSMTFGAVPSFYVVATNRPLDEFADATLLRRHGIGVEHLQFDPQEDEAGPAETAAFREAIIRARQREGVYGIAPGDVSFLGPRLFRTDILFPSNLPTGQYLVGVFLFQDGTVIGAQTSPLFVSQVGMSAAIVRLARGQAAVYGLAAVAIALAAGWAASVAFRRATA